MQTYQTLLVPFGLAHEAKACECFKEPLLIFVRTCAFRHEPSAFAEVHVVDNYHMTLSSTSGHITTLLKISNGCIINNAMEMHFVVVVKEFTKASNDNLIFFLNHLMVSVICVANFNMYWSFSYSFGVWKASCIFGYHFKMY